jgi:phage host-nuclease inhibitor protein Gam
MKQQMNVIKSLQKNFTKLMEMNDQILSNLPEEHQPQASEIRADISMITKAVKAGDLSKLQIIQEKYANNNTK